MGLRRWCAHRQFSTAGAERSSLGKVGRAPDRASGPNVGPVNQHAALEYLVATFGLAAGQLERAPDGRAVHAELLAGDQAIWLHPSGAEYRSPRELGGVSNMTVVVVDDVDAHYAFAKERGADIVSPPVDQPYGVREYGARDLEGHLWYFHGPLD